MTWWRRNRSHGRGEVRGPSLLGAAFVLVAGSWGCSNSGPADDGRADRPTNAQVAAARERADKVSGALGSELIGTLQKALAAEGPVRAVDVCASVAQEISQRVATEHGVEIGRTALRLRNPENRPDEWERSQLEAWEAKPNERDVVEAIIEQGDRWYLRQLRPIVTMDFCLQCHGEREAMSAPLRDAIAHHYPDDEAVGFASGDLRGAFTLRVPID